MKSVEAARYRWWQYTKGEGRVQRNGNACQATVFPLSVGAKLDLAVEAANPRSNPTIQWQE